MPISGMFLEFFLLTFTVTPIQDHKYSLYIVRPRVKCYISLQLMSLQAHAAITPHCLLCIKTVLRPLRKFTYPVHHL